MEENSTYTTPLNPVAVGFGVSGAFAIVFNTILTLVKESYPAVNAAMKAALGHHWTTHGVLVVIVFLIFGWIFSRANFARTIRGTTLSTIIVCSTILSGLGLIGWFLFV